GRRARSDRGERSARFFVAAVFVPALDGRAGLLAELFDEERCLAVWAGFIDRPVPERELAFRVIRAGVKRTAFLGPLLGQVASVLGTFDAERDGLRGLAGGVRRAGQELTEPAGFDHHGRPALLALLVRGLLL